MKNLKVVYRKVQYVLVDFRTFKKTGIYIFFLLISFINTKKILFFPVFHQSVSYLHSVCIIHDHLL